MNETTELNSELLSADARGRKHIPVAVFAVILIHVVLFVMLLIAAGCRSSARAKANDATMPKPAERSHPADRYLQAATNAEPVQPLASTTDPVVAEPVIEEERSAPITLPGASSGKNNKQVSTGTPTPKRKAATATNPVAKQAHYIVKAGDTVDKIAKRHGTSIEAIKVANKLKGTTIYPGQKLVVKPTSAGSTAQVKNGKSRNEV